MICPKCRKVALERLRTSRPLGVWRCPGCAGIWVPHGLAARVEPPVELGVEVPHGGEGSDERTGLCPEGHGLLLRARADVGADEDLAFSVERCSHCLGVWFEAGEWQAVAAADLADGLWSLWDPSWQRTRRVARFAASEQARFEGELGIELMQELATLAERLRAHPARETALRFLREALAAAADNQVS